MDSLLGVIRPKTIETGTTVVLQKRVVRLIYLIDKKKYMQPPYLKSCKNSTFAQFQTQRN